MFNSFTEEARNLLALCTVAGEPILISDVLAMAPDLFSGPVAVREAADQAGERIYGDGEDLGYTVSDPELQAVWMTELQSSTEWLGWQQRFLSYGKQVLEDLRLEKIEPRQAPACVIYGYCKALESAGAPLTELTRLLCRPWADAWEWLGWPQGFQAEALRIFDRASQDPANLGILLLAGLCHAAVGHWVAIPPQFMGEAMKRGLISPAQVLALAELANGHPNTRKETLEYLYPLLPRSYARQLDDEVAELNIRFIAPNKEERIDLGNVLSEEEADQQLDFFERSPEKSRSEEIIYKIIGLVDRLPPSRIERGLDLWEEATDFGYSFPTDVILRLPEPLIARVYSAGITMLYSGDKHATESGIDVLSMLLPRMTNQQVMDLIELHRKTVLGVYSIEAMISDLPTEVLERLYDLFSQNAKREETTHALEELQRQLIKRREDVDTHSGVSPSAASSPRVAKSEPEYTKELTEIRAIHDPSWRVTRLIRLAQQVGESKRGQIIDEALAELWAFSVVEKAARVIMELGPVLTAEQAEPLFGIARRIPLEHQRRGYASWSRSQAVLALAEAVSEDRRLEILEEAVQWALEEADPSCRERVFYAVVGRLPAGLRYPILQGLWDLYGDDRKYKGWSELNDMLPRFSSVWFEMCTANDVDPYGVLVKTLKTVMRGPIWCVSGFLRAFHTPIFQLGGERAILEAVQADLDARIGWGQ